MRPGQYLTRTLVWFDNKVVDGAVNGTAAFIGGLSGPAASLADRLRPLLRPVDARSAPSGRRRPGPGEARMT
jgi:hypothetical protein